MLSTMILYRYYSATPFGGRAAIIYLHIIVPWGMVLTLHQFQVDSSIAYCDTKFHHEFNHKSHWKSHTLSHYMRNSSKAMNTLERVSRKVDECFLVSCSKYIYDVLLSLE